MRPASKATFHCWPFASLCLYTSRWRFWISDLYRSILVLPLSTNTAMCWCSNCSNLFQQLATVVPVVLRYWFSPATVSTFVAEICDKGGTAALVSTPSVYFSLPEASDSGGDGSERTHFLTEKPKSHGYLSRYRISLGTSHGYTKSHIYPHRPIVHSYEAPY